MMRNKWITVGIVGLLLFGASLSPVLAGDYLYGRVADVKSADLVVLDHGRGQYNVRIIGIAVPKEGPLAEESRRFVSTLVLGKTVRLRFERRTRNGEMLGKLLTDEPEIRDVGIELLRAGLARKQANYDYKYGELSRAEAEARRAKRGLWATQTK
jgi:endonuclease YncB( thermonuclease family)